MVSMIRLKRRFNVQSSRFNIEHRTKKDIFNMVKLTVFFTIIVFFIVTTPCSPAVVVIDTPNVCVKLDKVVKDKVYLITTNNTCVQMIGKIQVDIEDEVLRKEGGIKDEVPRQKEVSIYLDGYFWRKQSVSNFNMDDVSGFIKKGKERSENLKTPENIHKDTAEKIAEDANKYYKSETFQSKLDQEKERIQEIMEAISPSGRTGGKASTYYKDYEQGEKKASLGNDERLYVFISSSVPVHILRQYAITLNKLKDPNVIMVMRGFVNGAKKIRPTIDFISSIITKEDGCDYLKKECDIMPVKIIVDPIIFSKYGINEVPSFVYAKGVSVIDLNMSEGLVENVSLSNYYSVSGDAGLDYVLEMFLSETKSKTIEGLLYALRKGYY
jgi:type-F conjugative transfer system pilin assembly protein TrbC